MTALEQFLESRDFYELCQNYRHMPLGMPGAAKKAFDDLKGEILKWASANEFVSEYEQER